MKMKIVSGKNQGSGHRLGNAVTCFTVLAPALGTGRARYRKVVQGGAEASSVSVRPGFEFCLCHISHGADDVL